MISFVLDESFVSASLDGEIIVWSSNALQPIKQFNEIREFEGDSHLYPFSVQHLFVLDQVLVFCHVQFQCCVLRNLSMFPHAAMHATESIASEIAAKNVRV